MAVTLYSSTDTGAPILTGALGSLVNLLDKCLVAGYGSTKATATITSNGTNVSNNDTVTVDGTTYTFKTALTPAANEVLIGANAAASLANLAAAMMGYGTSGTTYGAGTTQKYTVQVTSVTATVLTMEAVTGGTGGNSLALSKSAATYSLSGATFSGGSGTDTKASSGWTKPYTATGKAVFRMGGGNQFYLDVDDSGPGAGLGKEVRVRGYETMTAVATGTNAFPTAAQAATALFLRKSASLDSANRVWFLIADNRTFHLYVATGDSAGVYLGGYFGDIYSVLAGDAYRTVLIGRITENSASTAVAVETYQAISLSSIVATQAGHYIARQYTGLGGSLAFGKSGDGAKGNALGTLTGGIALPNGPDQSAYLAQVWINDGSGNVRGYLRGVYQLCHQVSGVNDQDIITGAGAFSGRTFRILKSGPSSGLYTIETSNTWDTSS